jgi:predicted nucleotidyltransferase
MKAVGLVTEYNPFHNGHAYHAAKAKEITGADVVVAVMSGNFIQRGEPAILDKWTRANMALQNGVDLVIELPVFYAVQPSHLFAKGAVQLLAAMGIQDDVFGAEHADVDWLDLAKQAPQAENFGDGQSRNQTFASAYAQELAAQTGFVLEDPNDILALGYAKAVLDLGLEGQMHLHAISRLEAGYHDTEIADQQQIASASAVRLALHKNKWEKITNVVPPQTLKALREKPNTTHFEGAFWQLLRYRLLTDTVGQIGGTYQMAEGLEHRLTAMTMGEPGPQSLQSYIKAVKSKRYTYARIQRTLLYTLLNIKVDQMQAAMADPYLRLLGYTTQGQSFLNAEKKNFTLPLISRVDMGLAKSNLRLDYKAGKLWQMLAEGDKIPAQDVSRVPLAVQNTVPDDNLQEEEQA